MKNSFKKITLAICFLGCSLLAFGQYPGYTLVWSDEFDGNYTNADATTGLNLSNWTFELGNGSGGWGTGQLDYATNNRENVEVSDGTLKIRTQRNHPNQTREYTSGRIVTKNKQGFLYGKIEARIRTINMTESGRGFAFWMMPNSLPVGATSLMWPQGGELDIFEYNGLYPQYNLSSVHHAWKWNNNNWGGDGNHAGASSVYNPLDRHHQYKNTGRGCGGGDVTQGKTYLLGAEWHIYGINWYNDRIEFYVDNDIFHVFYHNWESWCGEANINNLGNHFNKAGFNFNKIENDGGTNLSHNQSFRPLENPFYIILSAGVGGNGTYGGHINNGNNPPQWTCTTEIDWVRAYKLDAADPPMIAFAQQQHSISAGNTTVTPVKICGDNIAKIEYFVDSWQNRAQSATGSSFVWNATAGCHTLHVRAANAAGYWGNWATVKYSVNGACGANNTAIITAVAGSNGKITPSGNIDVNYNSVSVNHGTNKTFNFIANNGYKIDKVYIDGINNAAAVTAGEYTFTNVTSNHTVYVTFVEGEGTSIDLIKEPSIVLYPNPVKNVLHITVETDNYLSLQGVEITDLAGRIIVNYPLLIVNYIDVSHLPQGIYFLKIQTDKGIVTKKFINE